MVSRLLFKDNRLVLGGGRLAMATPECIARCCEGGCPSWRLLALCDTTPTCDGTPPPNLSAWICTTVTCLDGSPIVTGQRVKIDELCWTATFDVRPTPMPGSYIITGNDPVQCVGGCDDEACPPPTLWYPGTPCNGANPPVYFCGVPQCGVYPTQYGCYKVDPSNGGIPLPPGALVAPVTGAPLLTCCACENGCAVCPLMGNDVPSDPSCYPPDLGLRTCCRSNNACERLIRYRGTQTLTVDGQIRYIITNEAVNPSTQPDGTIRWQIQTTRYFPPDPPEVRILPFPAGVAFGCGRCPTWNFRAARTWLDTDFNTGQGVYAEECNGYPDNGNGISLTVGGWQNNTWTCDRMVQDVTYTYREPVNRSIVTHFEYESRIEDQDGGLCEGRCAGRGVSAERRNATTAGCSGCGKGLVTTRLT